MKGGEEMIKTKHVLLWFVSLLFCLNVSSVALANTTSSQVGIYFTEEIEEKNEVDQNESGNSNSLDEKSDGTSSYLPQTGECKDKMFIEKSSVIMLGLLLLMSSMIEKKRKKEQ